MRTEKEMLDIIIATAENDERIRAAYMNGSRANPSLPKDIYQDYDIVYVVQNIDTFIQDNNWIDIFGKRLMLQMPESMRGSKGDGRIVYLMLFDDGTRIDLTLIPIQKKHLITEEKLKPEETRKFVENAFRDGVLKTTGTDIDRLMPPVSRFGGGGSRDKKKQTVIEKLKGFFEKYFGLVSPEVSEKPDKVTYLYDTEPTLSMVAEEPVHYEMKKDN